ncbi:hypothetical protein CRG98_017581 [Punica granatum]|uniref:Uncharacterized protein n=1 Tax=Punica granatum TaxID=22663 RepID=A0A2I0K0D9_PUNGR|nr:hypothetical protein CRG98_017581 [Punica granatum]
MGLQKFGLDLCWVGFELFWLCTDPNSLNRPCWKLNRPEGTSRVRRRHGGSRWNFEAMSTALGHQGTPLDKATYMEKKPKEIGWSRGSHGWSWKSRGPHSLEGKFRTKFGSQLIACSRFVAQTNVELPLYA